MQFLLTEFSLSGRNSCKTRRVRGLAIAILSLFSIYLYTLHEKAILTNTV